MTQPKRAYTVRQVAGLLGVPEAATRALLAESFDGARDLISDDELRIIRALARSAHTGGAAPDSPQLGFDFGERAPASRPDSEGSFRRAVELEPERPAEALTAYGEAIAADPRHADALVNRGRLLHELGELQEAEAHYVAALVARPTDATAVFNLAVALEDSGRFDEAMARYQQAIELDPRCVDAYFNLARLYERKGDKMAAIRHLKDYRRLVARRS